jgi:hypothetical protein
VERKSNMKTIEEFKLTKEQRYQLFLEDRKMLVDAWREGSRTFDKAILTFSSGAFAVSIAFLKDVVPYPFPNTLCLLGWSWALFSAALIIILFSFIASQKACEAQIDITYDDLINNTKRTNSWSTVTAVCNYSSIIVLGLAFLFAGCFVYWNIIYIP